MKDWAFRHRHVVDQCLELCRASGICAERVACVAGSESRFEHLAAYGDVDIALDTWPYGGSTTTCEALWMGVPVVTLTGDGYVGRMSASLLTQVGLPQFSAASAEEYVACAVQWAGDVDALQQLRGQLRNTMAASALCDGPGYARRLEHCYREMWRRWCADAENVRRAS